MPVLSPLASCAICDGPECCMPAFGFVRPAGRLGSEFVKGFRANMNVQNKAQRRFFEEEMKITANELEYLAENEDVEIVPRFQFDAVTFLQRNPKSKNGQFGPFLPLRPVIVPLWLALQLKQQKLCSISPPAWMSIEKLTEILEKERKSRENNLLTEGPQLS